MNTHPSNSRGEGIPDSAASSGNLQRLAEVLFDLVPDFLVVVDSEGRCVYVNRAAALYLGHDKRTMHGRLLQDTAPGEYLQRYKDLFESIAARGEPSRTEALPFCRPDGTMGFMTTYAIPFRDPDTDQRMMLVLSQDVTSERVFAQEHAARASLQRELEIARDIQQSLLPRSIPTCKGFEIAALSRPAGYAGGDFYDVVEADNGQVVVVLGDVTGHGVGAALIASACRTYARVALRTKALSDAMSEVDHALQQDLREGSFVTLVFVSLRPESREVAFLSAGHGPVIVRTRTESKRLMPHGPPAGLGLFPADAQPSRFVMGSGSDLLIPSDGIFEARSESGEQFGIQRLVDAAAGNTAQEILSRCFAAVESWCDGRGDEDDDQTLVVIRAT